MLGVVTNLGGTGERSSTNIDNAIDNDASGDLHEPLLPVAQQNGLPQDQDIGVGDDSSSSQRISQEPRQSRNVPLVLLYTFCNFAGRSLWSQSVLATFVFLLTNDNPEDVGLITAVMGTSQLVMSFPAGVLADKYRRDTMLKLSSGIGIVAILSTICTLVLCSRGDTHGTMYFSYLAVSLAIWGCFRGVSNTSLSALFADSIPTGQRSKFFTQRTILTTLGNTTGPFVALVMFFFLGDNWSVKDCATVMLVGQLVCAPPMVLLCLMNDDYAVNVPQQEELPDTAGTSLDGDESRSETVEEGTIIENSELSQDESLGCSDEREEVISDEVDDIDNQDRNDIPYCGLPSSRVIPVFVVTGDLLSSLGAGMSIRYFPIFFLDNLKISPVAVQVLYFASPVIRALLIHVAQKLSKRFGRMRVVVALKWIGIALTISMIVTYLAGLSRWLVCIIYIVRSAFMNSTGALTRSMLMDNVPQEERGKWAALESINTFSWSGTAAIGGLLVAKFGIIPLFGSTAVVQFIATLPIVALLPYDKVP